MHVCAKHLITARQQEAARTFQDSVNSDPLAKQDYWVEFVKFVKGQGVDELERARCLRVLQGQQCTEVYRLQQDPLEAERLLDGDLKADEVEQEALAAVKKVKNQKHKSWYTERTEKLDSNPNEVREQLRAQLLPRF